MQLSLRSSCQHDTLIVSSTLATAAEVRVLSVGLTQIAAKAIPPEFEKQTVHKVTFNIDKQSERTFDAVILSVPAMDNHTRAHEPRSARLCAADDRHFMFALSAYPTVGSLSLARYGCS